MRRRELDGDAARGSETGTQLVVLDRVPIGYHRPGVQRSLRLVPPRHTSLSDVRNAIYVHSIIRQAGQHIHPFAIPNQRSYLNLSPITPPTVARGCCARRNLKNILAHLSSAKPTFALRAVARLIHQSRSAPVYMEAPASRPAPAGPALSKPNTPATFGSSRHHWQLSTGE